MLLLRFLHPVLGFGQEFLSPVPPACRECEKFGTSGCVVVVVVIVVVVGREEGGVGLKI